MQVICGLGNAGKIIKAIKKSERSVKCKNHGGSIHPDKGKRLERIWRLQLVWKKT